MKLFYLIQFVHLNGAVTFSNLLSETREDAKKRVEDYYNDSALGFAIINILEVYHY